MNSLNKLQVYLDNLSTKDARINHDKLAYMELYNFRWVFDSVNSDYNININATVDIRYDKVIDVCVIIWLACTKTGNAQHSEYITYVDLPNKFVNHLLEHLKVKVPRNQNSMDIIVENQNSMDIIVEALGLNDVANPVVDIDGERYRFMMQKQYMRSDCDLIIRVREVIERDGGEWDDVETWNKAIDEMILEQKVKNE